MSITKGDVLLLTIGGVQLGALVSNALNMSSDILDKGNKDLPGVKQHDAGETGGTLSVESLYDPAAAEGFSEALGYLKAGTIVTFVHGFGAYTQTGSCMISSIDLSGPKNEISSYSLEMQVTGAVTEGTGYGPVLNVSTCENDDTFPFDTLANITATGFDAITDGSGPAYAGTADELTIESGSKYYVQFDLVSNSGSLPLYNLALSLGGSLRTEEGSQTAVAGANAFTFTATASTVGVLQIYLSSVAGDFEITNLSVREVL